MYRAKKPCHIGGRLYGCGDDIADELIDPVRAKQLIKYGLIERAAEKPVSGTIPEHEHLQAKPSESASANVKNVLKPNLKRTVAGKGGK